MSEKKKRRSGNMLGATIVMGLVAFILFAIAYFKGGGEHIEGVKSEPSLLLRYSLFSFLLS